MHCRDDRFSATIAGISSNAPYASEASASRYKLIQRLAVGGMGEIHLAHDAALGRRVVIKYLLPEAGGDSERVAMFLHEARAVALCEHPNIVRIFDVGLDRGRYFMALEHLEGWDTASILTRLRDTEELMPLPIALRLIVDAANGLHAAHEAASADGQPLRLVHRDVSLHNLFVTRDGVLKVLDFGVAKTDAQVHSTAAGTLKGTLAYMSPEQCSCVEIDRRSDVFSLGVVAYELITGQRLFKRQTSQEIVAAVVQAHVPLPARPIGEELLVILRRALAQDRELRIPTAAAFAEALLSHPVASRAEVVDYVTTHMVDPTRVDAVPLVSSPVAEMPPPPPPREPTSPTLDLGGRSVKTRRKAWSAIAAVTCASALVLCVVALRNRGESADAAQLGRAPTVPASTLPALPTSSAVAPASGPTAEESPAISETPPPTAKADTTAKTAHHPAKAAPKGVGLLTLDSEPWADVYVNGSHLGQTPLVRHEVPAGRLRLRLVNNGEHLTHNQIVDLKTGGELRVVVDLQQRTSRVVR